MTIELAVVGFSIVLMVLLMLLSDYMDKDEFNVGSIVFGLYTEASILQAGIGSMVWGSQALSSTSATLVFVAVLVLIVLASGHEIQRLHDR